MHMLRLVALLGLLAYAGGCTTIKVASDFDPQANFSSLHSYAFHAAPASDMSDPRVDNSLLDERIRAALDTELSAKGFQKLSGGSPDFLVSFHVGVQSKLDVTTLNRSYPYYGGYYGAWGGYQETMVREYEQGTLMIDVIDPATGNLIWRGSAQSEVRDLKTPEARTKRINVVVERVLKDFPPQKKE
jgi:hypothetical protein